MITVAKLLERTRLLANDMGKTNYSDYEITVAIESSCDVLCEYFKKYASPEIVRRTLIDIVDGEADLPEGFLNVVNVEDVNGNQMFSYYESYNLPDGCYRIEGDKIYSSEDQINFIYMKKPFNAVNVDVSEGFFIYIASASANFLKGENDAAYMKLEDAVIKNNMDKRGAIPDPLMWA
jgi:hypothetical protein